MAKLTAEHKARILALSLAKHNATDIGRILGFSPATVKKHMSLSSRQRAKKSLP